jgi:predicted AAA+ superfamily ATPase
LEQVEPFVGTPLIKVLTGIRRSGKSCLLRQIAQRWKVLKPKGEVVFVDMELSESAKYRVPGALEVALKKTKHRKGVQRAILIDEAQEIPEWERLVNSLLKEGGWDIYLTGSNAHLLSSELATLLAGRYVEIHVLPLSYAEHLEFRETVDSDDEFREYLRFGGLPGIHELPRQERPRLQYLSAVQDSVLLRDVIERNAIREPRTLESVLDFVYDNVGSFTTAKSMSDYLKSQRVNISVVTLQNYLRALESGFAVYRADRYDIKGRRMLEVNSKYYLADLGLRFARLGSRDRDIAGLLENVVYLELLRRGNKVSVGRLGELEVDFVAEKDGQILYVQVATTLGDSKTREREYRSLEAIPDNYPKMVVTLDRLDSHQGGIRHVPMRQFLLEPGIG